VFTRPNASAFSSNGKFYMVAVLITAIEGNKQRLDGGAMFGNAPKTVWEKWVKPDAQNRIPLNCRAMLLEINGKKILCETGIGAFFEPKLADRYGVVETTHQLLSNLAKLGTTEAAIDYVILSHLHFDHAGGLLPSWQEQLNGRKDLLFANAKYVVSRSAFERAKKPHPRDKASFIPGLAEQLESSGRLIIVDGSSHSEVFPEILSFFFSDGHTPGHMHTIATSGAKKIVFAGDLVPGRAWVHLPITMGYDRNAEQVIDEKKKFFDKFANDNSWIFYTHDHEVAMSHVRQTETKRYEPYGEVPAPTSFKL